MHTDKVDEATIQSFAEACASLKVTREELHQIIDNGEVDTVTNVDGRIFVVVGNKAMLDWYEIYRLDLLEEDEEEFF